MPARRRTVAAVRCLQRRQRRSWLCVFVLALGMSLAALILANLSLWAYPAHVVAVSMPAVRSDELAQPVGPPTATFSADVVSGTVPFDVVFTNQSAGDYESCRWDFGDGSTSTACAPPAHTYTTAGAFHVSLIVQGGAERDSLVRQGYINAGTPDQLWLSNGPDGGSVHDLVMALTNPDIRYAATDRGVFKSADGGDHWQATNHPALVVRSLAVAPDDPAVVFSGSDDGVYKSVDGGEIWLHQGLDGTRVNSLAIRHDDGQVIFAAAGEPRVINETTIGVFRSNDGGASWQHVYAAVGDDAVMDLLIDGADGGTIYAGIMGGDGLAVSVDGGDAWTNYHVALDEGNSEEVYALAVTPAGATTPALYAFSVSLDADVYKSTNHGESWSATYTPAWWMAESPAALAVDPVDPQVVYVGVTDYHGQLLRSVDGGGSWAAIQHGLPEGNPTAIVVDPRDQAVMLAQEEGDIYRSADHGDSWQLSCAGLRNVSVDDLVFHPKNRNVALAAVNGRGHALASTADGGDSWSYLTTAPADVYNAATLADVGAIAYAPGNGDVLYAADAWGYRDELYLYRSADGGLTWQPRKIVEIGGDSSYMGASAVWVYPVYDYVVLVGVAGWGGTGGGGVYRSVDGGLGWTRTLDQWTNALVSDPANPNTLYAASEQCGRVYRTVSNGNGWIDISPTMPPGECWVWAVNDLVVTSHGQVLAATSAGLWLWDGASWSELPGLPAVELTAVTVDPLARPEAIYVGTGGAGVLASYDGGATWTNLNAGLGSRTITELAAGRFPNRRLYAGTVGGGIWYWALSEPMLEEHLWVPQVRS
jgi:PKD repeat protein